MKLLYLLIVIVVQSSLVRASKGGSPAPAKRGEVLVLDLDGTLYEDDCLIETQIKENCWVWGKERFGLNPDTCQQMHEKYGSTIQGVCKELGAPVAETVRQYYNEVYPNMDFGRLRKYSISTGTGSSGYSHGLQSGDVLQALKKLKVPIVLASNSPVFHVKRALTRLGIADLKIDAFMTPERIGGILKTDQRFWEPLFDMFPSDDYRCSLIDDNGLNIKLVSQKLGMRGFRITPQQSLAENLLRFLDVNAYEGEEPFCLDPVMYLEAKRKVDDRALNKEVLSRFESELALRAASLQERSLPLRVVDLGAGLLSMLPKVMSRLESDLKDRDTGGKGHMLDYLAFESNPALRDPIRDKLIGQGFATHGERDGVTEYRFKAPKSGLAVTVFVSEVDFMSPEATNVAKKLFSQAKASPLYKEEEEEEEGNSRPAGTPVLPAYDGVDVILGCCVADLVDPRALAAQALEFGGDNGGLLYLPITFAGRTELCRSSLGSAEEIVVDDGLRIPSDEVVMSAYHTHLRKCGHHLDPHLLLRTLEGFGCRSLLAGGGTSLGSLPASTWAISREKDPYMFRCMMHFLALGTVLQQMDLWDVRGWFKGVRKAVDQNEGTAEFRCSNVDLLCSLPGIPQNIAGEDSNLAAGDNRVPFGDVDASTVDLLRSTPSLHPTHTSPPPSSSSSSAATSDPSATTMPPKRRHAVEFLGARRVRVVEEAVEALGAGQVLIETSCSVISTGTELKVFRGDVDPDEPADLTIAGLQEESMRYPMRYGYSLVGVVVKTGEGVDPGEWLGKRVFTFSPHSSAVVAPISGLMPVPDGIADEDAAFLPAMETAVSLAMAAAPLMGEKVAVIGQGLIGLLTGAVLKAANVDVTLVDVSPSRLQSAKNFVPQASLCNPASDEKTSDFDVVVEVSGAAGGLQGAVDMTGKNGRVVLGSLYGENELSLKLGLQFHRSGIQLITSQVSNIPPSLKGRWTKKRRFDLSWDFIRRIRPSRVLLEGEGHHDAQLARTFLTSDSVQETFKRLERGEIVTSLVVPKSARAFSSESQDDLSF